MRLYAVTESGERVEIPIRGTTALLAMTAIAANVVANGNAVRRFVADEAMLRWLHDESARDRAGILPLDAWPGGNARAFFCDTPIERLDELT
jgi:hypothetical protein